MSRSFVVLDIMSNNIKNSKWKKFLNRLCQSVLVIYFATYFVLSYFGHYSSYAVITGGTRLAGSGWPIRDAYVWEPVGIHFIPFECNFLGGCYIPCVLADRAWWHKNIRTVHRE